MLPSSSLPVALEWLPFGMVCQSRLRHSIIPESRVCPRCIFLGTKAAGRGTFVTQLTFPFQGRRNHCTHSFSSTQGSVFWAFFFFKMTQFSLLSPKDAAMPPTCHFCSSELMVLGAPDSVLPGNLSETERRLCSHPRQWTGVGLPHFAARSSYHREVRCLQTPAAAFGGLSSAFVTCSVYSTWPFS